MKGKVIKGMGLRKKGNLKDGKRKMRRLRVTRKRMDGY